MILPQDVYTTIETERLPIVVSRPIPYAFILLGVALRLLLCLAAIWMGMVIAMHGPNEGTAVLAAFACGGVIYGCLGRAR